MDQPKPFNQESDSPVPAVGGVERGFFSGKGEGQGSEPADAVQPSVPDADKAPSVNPDATAVTPAVEADQPNGQGEQARTAEVREPKRRGKAYLVGAGILALVAGGYLLGNNPDTAEPTSDETTAATILEQASESVESMSPEAQDNFAKDIMELFPGFNHAEDIAIGTDVVFEGVPQERGSSAFGQESLGSREGIVDFLDSDDERAQAARGRIEEALQDRPEELKRALNGDGYIAVQVKPEAIVEGTSYFKDGEILTAAKREVEGMDIFWLFVDSEGNVVASASIRDDCRNPGFMRIIPLTPESNAPPVEVPPTRDETTPTTPLRAPRTTVVTVPRITVPSTPPSNPTTTVPVGKDVRLSPVTDDPNHDEEERRPNIPAPPEAIQPEDAPEEDPYTPPVTVRQPDGVGPTPDRPATTTPASNQDNDGIVTGP